jgi:hypothetical protein
MAILAGFYVWKTHACAFCVHHELDVHPAEFNNCGDTTYTLLEWRCLSERSGWNFLVYITVDTCKCGVHHQGYAPFILRTSR